MASKNVTRPMPALRGRGSRKAFRMARLYPRPESCEEDRLHNRNHAMEP